MAETRQRTRWWRPVAIASACLVAACAWANNGPAVREEDRSEALTAEEQAARDLLERYRIERAVQASQRGFVAEQHFKVGKAHFELGAWRQARDHFKKCLELAPTHVQAAQHLAKANGLLGVREGRLDLGEYVKRRSIASDMRRFELADMMVRAKALYAKGQYAEAMGLFTRVRAKAQSLAGSLDTLEAAEEAESYIRKSAAGIEEKHERRQQERLRKAREEVDERRRRTQTLGEDQRRSRLAQAQELLGSGRYGAARQLAEAVLRDDPTDGAAATLAEKATTAAHEAAIDEALRTREARTARHFDGLRALAAPQDEVVHMPLSRFEEVRRRKERPIFGYAEEPPQPWEAGLREALGRKVSFDFVETPLQDVVSFLGTVADVTVVLDAKALDDPIPSVTLRVQDMRLGAALNWVCRLAGLGYTLKNEAIFISNAQRLHDRPVLRMFDVSDLTVEIRNFKGKQQALASDDGWDPDSGGGGGVDWPFDDEGDEDDDEGLTGESLIEFIKRIIAPGQWDDEERLDNLGFAPEKREGKGQELADLIGVTVGGRTYLAVRTLE